MWQYYYGDQLTNGQMLGSRRPLDGSRYKGIMGSERPSSSARGLFVPRGDLKRANATSGGLVLCSTAAATKNLTISKKNNGYTDKAKEGSIPLLVCIDHNNQYKWSVCTTSVRIMTFSSPLGDSKLV